MAIQKLALIVFGRLPVETIPAKTRLGKEMGNPELATQFGHALTKKTLRDFSKEQFPDFDGKRFFCFGGVGIDCLSAEALAKEDNQSPQDEFPDWELFPQEKGKDVRAMKEAFEHVFNLGFETVLLVGTDIIGLDQERIEELFEILKHFDVCIQPLEDNGYGAIGMRKMVDVFTDIENFESHSEGYDLIGETEALCNRKNVSFFAHPERLWDVDRKEDLERLLGKKEFWGEVGGELEKQKEKLQDWWERH